MPHPEHDASSPLAAVGRQATVPGPELGGGAMIARIVDGVGGRRAAIDLLFISVLTIVTLVASAHFDLMERIVEWMEQYEDYEVDELIAVVIVMSGAFLVFAMRRITELRREVAMRRELQSNIEELAYFDDLTGLPNRLQFMMRLRHELSHAKRDGTRAAILMIDLDRFREINDSLGHATGDELLRVVGERLRCAMRESDTVARLGGDKFLIIAPRLEAAADAGFAARRVMSVLRDPVFVGNGDVFATASIGAAVYPRDGCNPEQLLKAADMAMYSAKERGGNAFHFFTAEMDARAQERFAIATRLRHAVERRDFHLHYQPIVNTQTGNIEAVEALIRWPDDERTMISPDRFIPVAEENGLIVPIGTWVLDQACRQVAEWRSSGLPAVRLAVNASTRQFREPDFVPMVAQTLERHGLTPGDLELEITERLLMQDQPEIMTKLTALSDMGVTLSVDDFGTGYSSLSYLKRFPVASLKVDRSFVRDVNTDPEDAALIAAIVAMADGLGLATVAEGVESFDQLQFLRQHACKSAQGFYISRPLPPEDVVRLLSKSSQAPPLSIQAPRPNRRESLLPTPPLEHLGRGGGLPQAGHEP